MKKKVVFSLCIPVLFLVIAYSFRITQIVCTIHNSECTPELYTQLQAVKGRSLFFSHIEKDISEAIPNETIMLTNIEKKLPGSLLLTFTQESPLYLLQSSENTFAVYSSGRMQIVAENTNLKDYHSFTMRFPLETVVENSRVRPQYHEELKHMSLTLYNPPFSLQNSTWKDTQTIQLLTDEGVLVLLPVENARKKIEMLQIVLHSPEVESLPEEITEIDLRYNYPVLRTKQ